VAGDRGVFDEGCKYRAGSDWARGGAQVREKGAARRRSV